MIYFTSDTHWYHKNIIAYCNRPFDSVEEMNKAMIDRWNERVKPDDTIYFLGDFAFCSESKACEIAYSLNGFKHWIIGNHDRGMSKSNKLCSAFQTIQDYKRISPSVQYENDDGDVVEVAVPIVLFHYPIMSWDGKMHGAIHLHGHTHTAKGHQEKTGYRLDVGVDSHDYYPWSLDEIRDTLALRSVQDADYHKVERT